MDLRAGARVTLLAWWIGVSVALRAAAQAPGATASVVHLPVFQTQNQSLFGPGTTPAAIDRSFMLVSQSWNESGGVGDVRSILDFQFGGRIAAATSGEIGYDLQLQSNAPGAVRITYPVRVELVVPAPNSFRAGEEIAIRTGYALEPGWEFATQTAAATVTLGSAFRFAASAGAEVCLFACAGANFFPPIDLPRTQFDIVRISSAGDVTIPLPGWTVRPVPVAIDFFGIRGAVDAPRVVPTARVEPDGRTLVAEGSHAFMTLSLDFERVINARFPILPPLTFQTTNLGGAQAGYHLLDIETPVALSQSQQFRFAPDLHVELRLPVDVAWRVTTASGAAVASGTGDVVRFAVGHTLHLTIPAERTDPLPAAPRYDLPNLFSSRTSVTLGAGVGVTGASFLLRVPGVQVTPDVTIDPCAVVGLSCPEVIPGIRSPAIDLDLGPLIQASADASQSADLFPLGCAFGSPGCGNWQLLGFDGVDAEPFQLDPEAPEIRVAMTVLSGVASGTGPPGTLVQTVALENAGDVTLEGVQVTDAVTPAAFEIAGVASPRLSVNPAFDAIADVNLLTGGDAIAAGGKDTVFAGFRVVPGHVYAFTVAAAGMSPIGTAVTDTAAARLAVYPLAIHPPPVQSASQGVLPATIPSGSGLDVRDVEPASIRLEGVPPLRWSYAPRDGGADLLLFFPRQAVLAALRARLEGAMATITARPAASDVTAVAHGVLGRPELVGDAQRLAADLLGNGNGRLDVGDLRALVRRRRAGQDLARALLASTPPGGRRGSLGMPGGTVVTAVLTAALADGTPVMSEDTIVLLDNGRMP